MAPDQPPPFPKYLLPAISLPFRRRHSSTTSTTSTFSDRVPSLSSSPIYSPLTTPSSSPPTAHFITTTPLTAHSALEKALQDIPEKQEGGYAGIRRTAPNTLKCITCATDIAFASQIVSKGFTGRHGRAYLVSALPSVYSTSTSKAQKEKAKELVNTKLGRSATRELLTGSHVVADVSCTICGSILGWKYVDAKEAAQRYKIGKFILEMKRVVLGVSWEEDGDQQDDLDLLQGEEDANKESDDVILFDSEDEDECEDLFAGIWDAEAVAKKRGRRVMVMKKDVLTTAR
ncbi:hypothetical protein G7Y89_g15429 [Cudoniella acicularis]|uniref:Yippee domain-containing protein n=1 Tax=Cudoniella acicularis TaxID=354080 RepID=A0A8H4VLI6_9HELO|nr:hypothetical protein G7Y89_g15429 [Cudoniella acicularis]